jgi:hypothetical protein
VGVLQRFERRLEGLVEGAFAKVFKGVVEPVEVAGALQREADDRKAIVGQGRVLVPNAYVVELGSSDHARLVEYSSALCREFEAMVREHAQDRGWSFVGPVRVALERTDDLDTGMFRVRSSVTDDRRPGAAYDDAPPAPRRTAGRPAGDATQVQPAVRADAPRLVVLSGPGSDDRHPDDTVEQVLELDRDVTLVGRTGDVHLRLADPGVSRRHLEVRRRGRDLVLTDLGSTNGTRVNGRPVQTHVLSDSDRIELGESSLVFRRDVL